MIIQSSRALPIGEIIEPERFHILSIADEHGIIQEPIPFLIIREVSREDFIASFDSFHLSYLNKFTEHYYEISTD